MRLCVSRGTSLVVVCFAAFLRAKYLSVSSYVSRMNTSHKNRKINEHVENLILSLGQPCDHDIVRQSCGVRLPHETQKFVIVERCTAAVSLM